MPDVKWFKLTTDMFDDEKIKIIESMPDRDAILIIWIKLIGLAAKINANGWLYLTEEVPYDEDTLATVLNRPVNTVRLAMGLFTKYRMIETNGTGNFLITNFEKHQNIEGLEKIREQNRLRTARFREKTRLLPESNVSSRYSNAPDKIRLEKNKEQNREDVVTDNNFNKDEIIDGQTIQRAIRIANGKEPALPRARKRFQQELTRRGIKWQPEKKKKVKANV